MIAKSSEGIKLDRRFATGSVGLGVNHHKN